MKNEETIYLTKEGLENFMKEIDEVRDQITNNGRRKSSAYSNAVGDGWHDNFDFEEAVREERRLMALLRDKREQLHRIVVVEEKNEENLVNVGDFVRCDFIYAIDDIEEKIIHLVGNNKPNFDADYLEATMNSPIGKAIYNKPIGSTVKYSVGNNEFTLNIKEKVLDMSMER